MSRIERVEILQVDLPPKVVRSDAIQSFTAQETPLLRITDADGVTGTGYYLASIAQSLSRNANDMTANGVDGRG